MNQVVWITGASSGIGEALALLMAQKGERLIITGRREERLQTVRERCLSVSKEASVETTSECFVLPFDLSQIDEIPNLVKEAVNVYGRIDILINNAGVSQRALISQSSLSLYRKIMEIDFFSPIELTKSILPFMKEQGGGQIGVVTSIVGKFGFPLRGAYSASKHALHGFFDTLRAEEESIDVTIIVPGRVKTEISLSALGKEGQPHNTMDPGQENGISSELAAKKIEVALRKRRREVLVGGRELLLVYIRRFFPPLYYRILRKIKAV